MRTVLFLACILSAFTFSLGDWQHPHYSFRCLENGGIELYGLHKDSKLTLEKSCENTPFNDTYTYTEISKPVPIPSECVDTIQNKSVIHITVHDPLFDETTTSSTPSHISGGHGAHEFIITCMDIPDEGVNKTVAHVFHETNSNKLPENYKEVDDVEMRFKAVKDTAAPDISSIYVGDEFYMYIKYMGTQPYWVVPKKCEAFEGTAIPKDYNSGPSKVTLWTDETYGCAKYNQLLEPFERVNETLVYAKMYGFRFTGGEYVTITCDVTIYKNKQDVCMNPIITTTTTTTTKTPTSQQNKATTTTAKPQQGKPRAARPKRDIGNVKLQTHSVFNKMRVLDSDVYQMENKSQHNNCGISVWIVALITTILYRQWV